MVKKLPSIVEKLAQYFGPDEHAAVLRHGDRFVSKAHPPYSFDNKIKFLHFRMTVECVGAFGRETPESRAQDLTFGALKKIRVGDFHHVGGPPGEVFRFDNKETIDRCHLRQWVRRLMFASFRTQRKLFPTE